MSMLQEAAKIGGVKKLAIVDDAYDPPEGGEIKEQAFNQFVQRLEDDEALVTELQVKSQLAEDDLNDWEALQDKEDLIQSLWALHVGTSDQSPPSPGAKDALKLLFSDIEEDRLIKLTQLKPLEDMLAGLTDIALLKLGSDTAPETIATVDVIFLDLFLSGDIPAVVQGKKPPQSVLDKARARALRYLNSVKAATKDDAKKIPPAFILISSIATELIGRNFRKEAKQAVSRYRFVQKDAITRGEYSPIIAIADILRTSKASALIEPLIRAWPVILGDASKWVQDRIELLDIADFGRLHSLSLQKEGQPVEDYLKELLASALAEQVAKAFSNKAPVKVGTSPFAEMPGEYFDPPSNAFAELYGVTRISSDRGFRGLDGTNPMSGDIYFEGKLPKVAKTLVERSILAVMSPICDLVERGDKPPAAKSVLLLRGKLAHSQKQKSDPNPLVIGSRIYEIDWDLKYPQALSTKDLKKKVKKEELSWIGRLRPEHFLSLQGQYLSSLGRVGVLKPPVHFEALAGRVCIRENGNEITIGEAFRPRHQFAFLAREHDKVQDKQPIFFTGEFVGWFLKHLTALQQDLKRSDATKVKAKALTDNFERVVALQKSQVVSNHKYNDVMAVKLAADSTEAAAPTAAIQILLWRV
ncbi:MAG: hypothetical protein KF723_02650 [Rhizobiaceae bacterium]|nr:hypothetical protein [Rhizobiaceae bacterium]